MNGARGDSAAGDARNPAKGRRVLAGELGRPAPDEPLDGLAAHHDAVDRFGTRRDVGLDVTGPREGHFDTTELLRRQAGGGLMQMVAWSSRPTRWRPSRGPGDRVDWQERPPIRQRMSTAL
jgi:hypothetical protein